MCFQCLCLWLLVWISLQSGEWENVWGASKECLMLLQWCEFKIKVASWKPFPHRLKRSLGDWHCKKPGSFYHGSLAPPDDNMVSLLWTSNVTLAPRRDSRSLQWEKPAKAAPMSPAQRPRGETDQPNREGGTPDPALRMRLGPGCESHVTPPSNLRLPADCACVTSGPPVTRARLERAQGQLGRWRPGSLVGGGAGRRCPSAGSEARARRWLGSPRGHGGSQVSERRAGTRAASNERRASVRPSVRRSVRCPARAGLAPHSKLLRGSGRLAVTPHLPRPGGFRGGAGQRFTLRAKELLRPLNQTPRPEDETNQKLRCACHVFGY